MEVLQAGESFGPYVVEGLVAGGGMGQVYAARHSVYGSVCAMKVLHRSLHEQADWRKRFTEEGLVGAQLKHPHVLSAREIVEHDGRLAIVMDLVKGGQTLEKVMSREFPKGLPLVDALQLFLAITQGLEYLHGKQIVHGDLKPENVMVEGDYRNPDSWSVLVTDFGTIGLIAHPVVIDGRTAVVATPRYASPEHLRGVDRIEVRSDVYCLGLLLHYLLSGEHVSHARTVREAAMFVMDEVSAVRLVDQPECVQNVFKRAVQPDPAERYGDCRELALGVREALDILGVKLEVEDVLADLATEVDEERARAQALLADASEAPSLPAGHTADPEDIETEIDAARSAEPADDAPPKAFDAGLAGTKEVEPPVTAASPAAEAAPEQTVESVPEAPVEDPSVPGFVPEPLPFGKGSASEVTLGAPLGTEEARADDRDEQDLDEDDHETGDSVVDATMEAEPLKVPSAPISAIQPPPPANPLVPMAIGIVLMLAFGLAVVAFIYL